MARPAKRYTIRVRGDQRDDIDADLLMQALLLMAEEADQARIAGRCAETDARRQERRP